MARETSGQVHAPRGLCNGLSECFCLDYRQVIFRGGGGVAMLVLVLVLV